MTTFVERFVARIPGSNAVKAPIAAFLLCAVACYPTLANSSPGQEKQGHSYFSSERPEAVAARQDKIRKLRAAEAAQKQNQS